MKKPQDDGTVLGYDDYSICLGDEMRGLRATMGKSLLDVERDLNIRAVLINAIEQADVDSFEAKWVIPGHVRTYSKYLGMDPEDGYQRFCRESGFVAKPGSVLNPSAKRRAGGNRLSGIGLNWAKSRSPRRTRARDAKVRTPLFDKQILQSLSSSVLVFGLIVGIGYVGWTVYDAISSVRQAGISEQPVAGSETDSLLSVASASEFAPDLGSGGSDILLVSNQPRTMGEIRPGEFGIYSNFVKIADPAAAAPAIENMPEEQVAEIAPEAPETVDPSLVVLVPSRAAWVRVSKPDGTVINEQTLQAGGEYQVPHTAGPLRLRAGNSGSLYFIVGGEIYGPAGRGTSVAKDVDLAAAEIRNRFERVAADQVPQEVIKVGLNLAAQH